MRTEHQPSGRETPPPASRTAFAALRQRDYRIFWIGSAFTSVGAQFTQVATAWQMYELTDSAFQVGMLGLARGILDDPSQG